MNVLLDECLPRKLKNELKDHYVSTVTQSGWSGKKNGELLRLAEKQFDVFITIDQNLSYQQNISNVKIAVILLTAKDNEIETLRPLFPKVRQLLQKLEAGHVFKVGL
jgi:predicted nuclease of predicted toxin-antitoxin system